MTELELRQKVVARADEYIGVKKGSAAHHRIVDTYNSPYPNLPLRNGKPYKLTYQDNWCAGFGSVIAIETGLTDIVPIEVSCTAQIQLWQKMGRWVEDDAYVPQPGDFIYWYWQDGADYATTDQKNPPNHVGIVEKVDSVSGTMTIIEGNKGSESVVGRRESHINGRYIRGYGCPDYASRADKSKEPWYARNWAKATQMGFVDGTRPEDPITRAEVAEVAVRLVERFEGGTEDG